MRSILTKYITLFKPQSQSSPTSTIPFPQTGILDRRTIIFTEKKTTRIQYVQLAGCEQKRACNHMFADPTSSTITNTTGWWW